MDDSLHIPRNSLCNDERACVCVCVHGRGGVCVWDFLWVYNLKQHNI